MDENNIEHKLPLGLCKQVVMKLDSIVADLHEIRVDADLDPEDALVFEQISETAGVMMAAIVNVISKEIGEEEFLNEEIMMDEFDEYPGDDTDILDEVIDVE